MTWMGRGQEAVEGEESRVTLVRLGQLGEWVVYLLRKGGLQRMFIKQ